MNYSETISTPPACRAALPPWVLSGLDAYVLRGEPPGDLLRAALEHDLFNFIAAAARQDAFPFSRDLIQYIYTHAPPECHGSHTIVEIWCAEAAHDPIRSFVLRSREVDAALLLIRKHLHPTQIPALTTFEKALQCLISS